LFRFDPIERVFDDAKQVGASPDRWIKRDYTGFCEAEGFFQLLDKETVNQAHLSAYDLDRRIVGAGVLA